MAFLDFNALDSYDFKTAIPELCNIFATDDELIFNILAVSAIFCVLL